MLPEVGVARIVEAIGRYRSGDLSYSEAAEGLGTIPQGFREFDGSRNPVVATSFVAIIGI